MRYEWGELPGIPKCDRPVAVVLTFDRDGKGDDDYAYCAEHAMLITRTLQRRPALAYAERPPEPNDTCYAWKDL